MRPRLALPILLTAAAVLVTAAAANAFTTRYSNGPLTATFTAGTHYPTCKQMWPVTVTARANGRPVHAVAIYQFLSGGQLVNTQYPFGGRSRNPHYKPYHFYGSFYDNTFGPFGALAIGHTLNVRAVVRWGNYTAYPGTTVRVRKVRGCPPE
jgi:hypothetical protein